MYESYDNSTNLHVENLGGSSRVRGISVYAALRRDESARQGIWLVQAVIGEELRGFSANYDKKAVRGLKKAYLLLQ